MSAPTASRRGSGRYTWWLSGLLLGGLGLVAGLAVVLVAGVGLPLLLGLAVAAVALSPLGLLRWLLFAALRPALGSTTISA